MNDDDKLAKNVNGAVAVLAPIFRATADELRSYGEPLPRIGAKTQFNFVTREITFTPDHIDNGLSIGEEVSHYLHGVVNQGILKPKTVDEINLRKYVIETVGRYGAIAYLNARGEKYESPKWPLGIDADGENFWNYLTHELGYKRAKKLFELHGDTLLADLARMKYDYACDVLPRLAPTSLYERRVLPVADRAKLVLPGITRFF